LATLCIITKPFHTAGTFFGVLLSTEGETGGWVTVAESGELQIKKLRMCLHPLLPSAREKSWLKG